MELFDFLADTQNLIAIGVGLVCFATIISIATPILNRGNLEARLKAVSTRREELRRRSREALDARHRSTLRHADEGFFKNIVERLDLRRLLEDPNVADKLAQAGFRGPKPITTFYFFRFVSPFIFALAIAIYLFLINPMDLPTTTRIAASVGGLTLGYYAPNLYISNLAQKRRDSIVAAFPDALDLLLICVESGMSIEAAIQKVGQEIGSTSIELAEEMTLLMAELSYLPDRRQAYENLARRTNHPGIKSVATAMIQAERYGTPLGAALRVMAKENRDMRLAAAEKKAAQLPAKLTVPMILFFLPVLFMVILGPAVIKVTDTMRQSQAQDIRPEP